VAAQLVDSRVAFSSTELVSSLIMEAIHFSKMSVLSRTIRCHIPENSIFHIIISEDPL
jgi:hypothetical protein